MTKKFKNSFGVTGSPAQIEAFKEWAQGIGWEDKDGKDNMYGGMYFVGADKKNGWTCCGNMWCCNVSGGGQSPVYHLPAQWSEAMKAAEEVVEEPKPEFRPGQKVKGKTSDIIVLCSDEISNDHSFSGQVIGGDLRRLGDHSSHWDKNSFILHTDPVTI